MTWILRALRRSVGKKQLMALAGLGLCGFLLAHVLGNLLLYKGPEAFNDYAKHLMESPFLVPAEIGLAVLFGYHAASGIALIIGNSRARPTRYALKRCEGGATLGSSTMWITGPLILIFLIVHLINFRLADKEGTTLYQMAVDLFQSMPYTAFYLVSVLIAALHVSHGFASAFRTLGVMHPKYTPLIVWVGRLFALLVAVGFGSIPIWIHFLKGSAP